MKIAIETIPHDQHRYPTVGDWYFEKETSTTESGLIVIDEVLHIKVSKLSDWRREALIAVHELVEVLICRHAGVTQESVDKFDKEFEAHRHPDDESEPGDEPSAPYVQQHCIATGIERLLSAALDVKWKEYEEELNSLP